MKKRTWLKAMRVKKDMTIVDVCKIVGVTQAAYSAYENGISIPRRKHAIAIAKLFEFDVGMFYEDEIA